MSAAVRHVTQFESGPEVRQFGDKPCTIKIEANSLCTQGRAGGRHYMLTCRTTKNERSTYTHSTARQRTFRCTHSTSMHSRRTTGPKSPCKTKSQKLDKKKRKRKQQISLSKSTREHEDAKKDLTLARGRRGTTWERAGARGARF